MQQEHETVATDRKENPTDLRKENLTDKEAAFVAGVSVRMFLSLVAGGKAPGGFKIGRLRRWSREAIERWCRLKCPTVDHMEALDRAEEHRDRVRRRFG